MYSIVESVSVSREPLLPVICRRDENPLHLVYILFTSASAAGEVKTPSKRCTIRSPFRAVHCRENRKKPQSKMSNLFLSRLYCSTFLAPVPRWLCREMSESRQRPVVAPDAVFRRSFQHPGEGGQSYIRSLSQNLARSITSKNHAQSQTATRFDALFESKRINCDHICRVESKERINQVTE